MADIDIANPGPFADDIGLALRNINGGVINVKHYGATGDGVTDDSAAIAAAINASNAFKFSSTPGITPVVYAPAGTYKLKNTTLPIFWGGGGIIGDGTYKTTFILDPLYNGDVFSWSEAWYFNSYNDPLKLTGSNEDVVAGPIARDFTIYGDQTSSNTQIGLGFYDRCDGVVVENVHLGWLKRGLYVGAPKIQVQSYMRESFFKNLKCWECGTATLPAIEFTSTGAGDTTNSITLFDINIFGHKSVGMVLRGNPGAACRLMRFYGLRIESTIGRDTGECLVIGDPAMTGYIRDIYFFGLKLLAPGVTSYPCLRLTANSGANMPYLIGIHGGTITGGRENVAIDYGRAIAIEIENVGNQSSANHITVAATGGSVAPPLWLNGYGAEAYWVVSAPNGSTYACIRYPAQTLGEYSKTYDPPSLAAGTGVTTNVNASGCRVQDFAVASFSNDLAGLTISAQCLTDVVAVRLHNGTAAPIDLASGTLRVKVIKSIV